MRTLLATVAAGALLGTAGIAQDAADSSIYTVSEGDHYASNLIGSRLYTTEGDLGEEVEYATVSEGWNDVGEINDFVVGEDGSVQAVIVGVGGFLGIGEKDVAVSWDSVSETYDESGSRFLVVPMSQEELENAPAFEYEGVEDGMAAAPATDGAAATEMAESDAATAETEPATEMAEGDAVTSDAAEAEEQQAASEMGETQTDVTEASEAATDMAQAEATDQDGETTETALADGEVSDDVAAAEGTEGATVESDATMPEGYEMIAVDQVTAEQLEGATVRSASNEEWVGEISTLLLDDQGKITQAVVDVGGFLGIGEKPVAMSFDTLEIYRQGEDGALEVNVMATREELEGMEAYEDS